MLGEAIEDVENMFSYVITAVDGYRIGDYGASISRQSRVRQWPNKYPRQKSDVVYAVYKLFSSVKSTLINKFVIIRGGNDYCTLVEHLWVDLRAKSITFR